MRRSRCQSYSSVVFEVGFYQMLSQSLGKLLLLSCLYPFHLTTFPSNLRVLFGKSGIGGILTALDEADSAHLENVLVAGLHVSRRFKKALEDKKEEI